MGQVVQSECKLVRQRRRVQNSKLGTRGVPVQQAVLFKQLMVEWCNARVGGRGCRPGD